MNGMSSIDVVLTMSYISFEEKLNRDNYLYRLMAQPYIDNNKTKIHIIIFINKQVGDLYLLILSDDTVFYFSRKQGFFLQLHFFI